MDHDHGTPADAVEPAQPREDDEVLARRRADEAHARRTGGGSRRDEALAADVEDEAGYSTEIEQGAAAPRPTTPEETS